MNDGVFVTGFGSRIVPRAPFALTFRPPRFLVEHGGKAVAFGAIDGGLGFNPLGDASVEDVTCDIDDGPPLPMFGLHTGSVRFPIATPFKVFSTTEGTPWPFELQLEDATDADEMVHIRGPLVASVDLGPAPKWMRARRDGSVEKRNGYAAWREWEYVREGQHWLQRLYAVTLMTTSHFGAGIYFAVTAQCAVERAEALFAFSNELVASLSSTE